MRMWASPAVLCKEKVLWGWPSEQASRWLPAHTALSLFFMCCDRRSYCQAPILSKTKHPTSSEFKMVCVWYMHLHARCLSFLSSVVPNDFGARVWFHGRQFFQGPQWGVVCDDSSLSHLQWFLLLLHQLHLRPPHVVGDPCSTPLARTLDTWFKA